LGAYIEAFDDLGTGLDMSGFTNGIGEFQLMGTFIFAEKIAPTSYDDLMLEGVGPYYLDIWQGGNEGFYETGVFWRDSGDKLFIAHLSFLNADREMSALFLNIDVVVDDRLLDGDSVRVTFLKGDDQLYGNSFDDILKGGDGKDTVVGRLGDDKLYGEKGNDTLNGNSGKDNLFGGSGRDVFVFDSPDEGGDRISDFSVKDDTIHLDSLDFGALSTGKLNKAAFAANTTGNAADSSDRIIYETDSGKLFYDQDGKGGAGRVYIATLSPDLNLTQADFLVV
jgi:Ca2+-binding RTX toxin-like protein